MDFFSQYGEVDEVIVSDRHMHNLAGFRHGFVHFEHSNGAVKNKAVEVAVKAGSIVDSNFKRIKIHCCGNRKTGEHSDSIRIDGMDMNCNPNYLKSVFNVFGPVKNVFIENKSAESYNKQIR